MASKLAIIAHAIPVIIFGTASALAQDTELAGDAQCLRYVQSYERSFHVPSGLLLAVSLAETGKPDDTGELVPWPWTINVNGRGQFFDTKEQAVEEVRNLLDRGQRSIDIGCMQINLRYHPNAFKTIEDAFDPAQNVAYGAKYLTELHGLQGSWPKAVERYHSSENGRREQYRERVIALWNSEARRIVMNAVLAEDTDTPYHHAIRDFAAGNYTDALDKYQAIVDAKPTDRLGLLGVAMSYEALDRDVEAMQAYARYLAVEPRNETIRARAIQKALTKPSEAARGELESLLKAGVQEPDLYATLAEITSKLGDDVTAFGYAAEAVQRAPDVAVYQLNAGVLADRLNRRSAALEFYDRFIALFAQSTMPIDASIDSVRERVAFLRARL